MENLEYYNKLRVVPESARKIIQAGRLKGMNDVNPMWRIKILTENFGMCGVGWKYTIDRQWLENFGSETKAFCNISLYVKTSDGWSEAIPGTGGSSFVSIETKGPYVSDECYKMALTDAISVAMKALGVAADIYFEKDANYGSKYSAPTPPVVSTPPVITAPSYKKDFDLLDIERPDFFERLLKQELTIANTGKPFSLLGFMEKYYNIDKDTFNILAKKFSEYKKNQKINIA